MLNPFTLESRKIPFRPLPLIQLGYTMELIQSLKLNCDSLDIRLLRYKSSLRRLCSCDGIFYILTKMGKMCFQHLVVIYAIKVILENFTPGFTSASSENIPSIIKYGSELNCTLAKLCSIFIERCLTTGSLTEIDQFSFVY